MLYIIFTLLSLVSVFDPTEGNTLTDWETENYLYCARRLEWKLRSSSYSTDFNGIQIPPNLPDTTSVKAKLSVLKLSEVSDDQVFAISALVTLDWFEPRMALNDSRCDGSNAQFTVVTTRSLVWYPQWTISNGVGTVLPKEAWQFNPAIVYTDGRVTWKSAFHFRVECAIDVSLFPFDVQRCSIDLTSPHYDVQTLKYVVDANAIVAETPESTEAPFWRLIGQSASQTTTHYPSVSFRMLLQRRPSFYNVALIMPVVVVNIIMGYTFLLPAYQEEKTSTAGACVVAFFFIQIMFYDYVPVSSDFIPGLIIFLDLQAFTALGAYLVECRLYVLLSFCNIFCYSFSSFQNSIRRGN